MDYRYTDAAEEQRYDYVQQFGEAAAELARKRHGELPFETDKLYTPEPAEQSLQKRGGWSEKAFLAVAVLLTCGVFCR